MTKIIAGSVDKIDIWPLIASFFLHSGFNDPDIIREATSAGKEAQQVSEAVKQAPSAVKRQTECCVLL